MTKYDEIAARFTVDDRPFAVIVYRPGYSTRTPFDLQIVDAGTLREPAPVDLELERLRRRPVADVDIDGVARQLDALVRLGRAIAARSALLLIADPELKLAGERVEHIAGRTFEQIFGVPVGTVIEQAQK